MLSGQSMPEVLQEALRLANARRRGGGEGMPFSASAEPNENTHFRCWGKGEGVSFSASAMPIEHCHFSCCMYCIKYCRGPKRCAWLMPDDEAKAKVCPFAFPRLTVLSCTHYYFEVQTSAACKQKAISGITQTPPSERLANARRRGRKEGLPFCLPSPHSLALCTLLQRGSGMSRLQGKILFQT